MNGDVTNEIAGLFWNNDKVKCITRLMRWMCNQLLIITRQHLQKPTTEQFTILTTAVKVTTDDLMLTTK